MAGRYFSLRMHPVSVRERVGAPLSLASIARDLQVSPATIAKYLDILEALYIVFTVRPYHHRNIARALLKAPKVYFFDSGLVKGDQGARFENAWAAMLLKHVHFLQDVEGQAVSLHYIRDKQGGEVDLVVCRDKLPVLLAECKHANAAISRMLINLAAQFPQAQALQVVRELRQEERRGAVSMVRAADWLAGLEA